MKKLTIFLFIALIHFGLSISIIPTTMSVAKALNAALSQPTIQMQTLVAATRILHFPIVSLSWYSRQWFPGGWIYIPIFFNSLIWAGGIYFLVFVCRRILGKLNED